MSDSITNGSVTVNFIGLDGEIQPPGQVVQEITRPASDGRAFRVLGEKGNVFTLRGIADVGSSGAADTLRGSYLALKGTVCDITMRGQTATDYLCLDAVILGRKQVAAASGGLAAGSWLVTSEFVFVYAST